MTQTTCCCRPSCTLVALILSAIAGVLAAFLQITAVITVTPAFLWVAFGIAVLYLAVLAATARPGEGDCRCAAVNAVLAGILGTILFAVVLLAVGIVATSVVNAILVGLLVFFFVLILTATACLVRCQANCPR